MSVEELVKASHVALKHAMGFQVTKLGSVVHIQLEIEIGYINFGKLS